MCNKSNFYRIKGDIKNAEKYWKKAYNIDSSNDYVLANLAQVYAVKDDMDNFYLYLKEALELNYPLWRKKNINDKAYSTVKNQTKFKELLNKYKPAIYE